MFILMILFRELYIDLQVQSAIARADPISMFLVIDILKGMVLMYIMLSDNVISLYCLGMVIGWATDTRMLNAL